MAHTDSRRFPALQDVLSSYWLPGADDEPLADIAERIKADGSQGSLAALRGEIAAFLRSADGELDAAFEAEFVSYYWPGGDGLTARQWLTELDSLLGQSPDTSRDHRSGAWS